MKGREGGREGGREREREGGGKDAEVEKEFMVKNISSTQNQIYLHSIFFETSNYYKIESYNIIQRITASFPIMRLSMLCPTPL